MAKRTTQATWEDRLDRWRNSGQSLDDFAVREGVKPAALKWWKWKLGSKRGAPTFMEVKSPEPAEVAEVIAAPATTLATRYEIVLGNGRVVRVLAQLTEDELARVLAAAERAR